MSRILNNLSEEDRARLIECGQQAQFAFVEMAEIFRRGSAGLTLTGEEYATLEFMNSIGRMFSSGMLPSKEQLPPEKAIRLGRELIGADN